MTTLTMKDEKRLEIIQRVFRGDLTVVEAALILGVSALRLAGAKTKAQAQIVLERLNRVSE